MSDVQGGGRVFGGRYRVTGTLGHGGMATVYRAVDEQLGREVAVKVFRIGPVDHGERARAESEMQVLAAMRNPSLVTLYDAAIDDGDGESYLVMELVPGTDLAARLREGVLAPTEAAGVGAQVASGLAAVHAAGIVHRDVKPANVLVEPDPALPGGYRVKLADFGIALLRDAARVTGTGTVMGTAAYLAPEQVEATHVDGRADVYSLGLVLLEALTGRQAFPGTATESAMARLTRSPEIDQRLPVAWRTLLHTMTATDPTERPSATEAEERLRALARGGDGLGPERPGGSSAVAGAAAGAAGGAVLGAAAAEAAGADDATRRLPAVDADAATRRLDQQAPAGGDDAPTTVLGATTAVPASGSGGGAGGGAAGGGPGGSGNGGVGGGDGDGKRRGRTTGIVIAVVVAVLVVAGIVVALVTTGRDTPAPTESSTETTQVPPSDDTSPSEEPTQEQPSEEPSQQPSEEPSEEPSSVPSEIVPSGTPAPDPGATNPVETPATTNQ